MSSLFIFGLFFVLLVNRQLKPRPIKRNVLVLPLLLIFYAIYNALEAGIEIGESASLLLGAALGVVVGWIQGRFSTVYKQNGIWMTVGSIWTVAIWLLSVPIRLLVKYGFVELLDIKVLLIDEYAFVPLLLSLGAIVFGRGLYLFFHYPSEFNEAVGSMGHTRHRAQKSQMESD
jgi:hypothetical protein